MRAYLYVVVGNNIAIIPVYTLGCFLSISHTQEAASPCVGAYSDHYIMCVYSKGQGRGLDYIVQDVFFPNYTTTYTGNPAISCSLL